MKISKIQLIRIAAILLLFSACTSSSQKGTEATTISIDVNSTADYDHFFDKKYKAIPLETPENALVGEVNKMQIADSCIYIFDKGQKSIFAFDLRGHFLRKYSHVGQGQGEYVDIYDFEVYKKNLYVLSRGNKSIYKYTTDDQYLDKIELGDWYDAFQILNDNEVLLYSNFSNNKLYNIIRYDYQKGSVEDQYFPFKQNDSYSLYYRAFHKSSTGDLLITQPYDHSIYKIVDGNPQKICQFMFNTKDRIPGSTTDVSFYQMHTELRNKSVVKSIDCITQMDSVLYFTYVLDFYSYIAKTDLRSLKTYNARLEIQKDYPFAYHPPIMFWGTKAISVINAEAVIRMGKAPFPSDKNPDGLLHEDDNPVLFIRELK